MIRRAQQQVITFLAQHATTGAAMTGLGFADGEVKLSKDAAAFVDLLGARVTEVGQGWYAVTLTAAETDTTWLVLAIRKTNVSIANDPRGATSGHPSGAVVSGTATTFVTDLTEASADFWRYTGVRFTSGVLKGQVREIAAYDGGTKAITLAAPLSVAPSAGDRFNLIG